MNYIDIAKRVLNVEMAGIKYVRDNLNEDFNNLVNQCGLTLENQGKIILLGIGKSGQIGKKLASTLSSTGSRATFLHPVEALHGDLGIIQKGDICLAFSYSGESQEIITSINSLKKLGAKTFAITSSKTSTLATICDFSIKVAIIEEACPFNMAPTTTTTATLALGDALAICLMEKYQFKIEDYGRLHPAGTIGNTVSLKVIDLMRQDNLIARVNNTDLVSDAIIAMCKATSELCVIENDEKQLVGILTTGDLKRGIIKDNIFLKKQIAQVMVTQPQTITKKAMAIELLEIFEKRDINSIPVLDDYNRVVGVVDLRDLPKFKVI